MKIDERHPSVRKSYTGDPHQTVESKAQDRTVRHSRKKKTHNTAGNKDKDDEWQFTSNNQGQEVTGWFSYNREFHSWRESAPVSEVQVNFWIQASEGIHHEQFLLRRSWKEILADEHPVIQKETKSHPLV